MLEVDGKKLCQGNAILRYLARELGLGGKTSFDEAKADEFMEGTLDLVKLLPWEEPDEGKKVRFKVNYS